MRTVIPRSTRLSVGAGLVAVGLLGAVRAVDPAGSALSAGGPLGFDRVIEDNAYRMVREGRQTFRFDTFGDEAFWGDALQLHRAIAGEKQGGVGGGVSPKTALSVGLKVDVDALPQALQDQLKAGKVDLDDPGTTLALLKLNAVVGVTGFFDARGSIRSIGIQCAFCHSTVDDALAPGIGRRLDGWANRDLNVGAIVSLAPNLKPFTDLLGVDLATVKAVLASWGPGRFDAELDKDGKALRPDGKQAGTLIPPAFGLAGVNLHTWTGFGSVTYWNAYVAATEMHGSGTSSIRDSRTRPNIPLRRGVARGIHGGLQTVSRRNWPPFSSTSWPSLLQRRQPAASIQMHLHVGRACSMQKASAPAATCRRCTPNPGITC